MAVSIYAPAESYDLNNTQRDLSNEFTTLLQTTPGLLQLIGEESRETYGTSKKMEWLEDIEEMENDVINNAGAVLAAATTMTMTNGERFDTGMVIKFRDYDETMLITSVLGDVLTMSRNLNGAGAVTTVADGSTVDIISRPVNEYSRAHEKGIYEPSVQYNYYEKYREDIPFSAELINTKQYGKSGMDYVNWNIQRWMRVFRQRLARSIVWGERVVGTTAVPSKMRGVYTWLLQAGTNKTDKSGAAITATNINDLLASIYTDDTNMSDLVLYTDVIQARTIATFNAALANYMRTQAFDSQMTHGNVAVTEFIGDLQATGRPRIVVDKDAPAGAVLALNTAKLKVVYPPNGTLRDWDSKDNDAEPDEYRRAIRLIASLKMADHKYSHGMLYNAKKTL